MQQICMLHRNDWTSNDTCAGTPHHKLGSMHRNSCPYFYVPIMHALDKAILQISLYHTPSVRLSDKHA